MRTTTTLPNGHIDLDKMRKRTRTWEPGDRRPCPACGHTLGSHFTPHNGQVYWCCLAYAEPVADAWGVNMRERPHCGCIEGTEAFQAKREPVGRA